MRKLPVLKWLNFVFVVFVEDRRGEANIVLGNMPFDIPAQKWKIEDTSRPIAALFQDSNDEDWYSYFLLCLFGYQRLSHSWRVAHAISKGLLSMSLRKTSIPSDTVMRLLADIESNYPKSDKDEIRAPFVLDLDSDQEYSDSASVEHLAGQLDESVMFWEYTNFDQTRLN